MNTLAEDRAWEYEMRVHGVSNACVANAYLAGYDQGRKDEQEHIKALILNLKEEELPHGNVQP